MDAEYVISEDNYVRAMKLFAKFTPKTASLYTLVIAVLAVGAILGPPVIKVGAVVVLTISVIAFLLGRFVINPLLALRNHRKYWKYMEEPMYIRLLIVLI